MRPLTPAIEDYLRAIHDIAFETGSDKVNPSAIADQLGVTRASVTGMLQKMASMEPNLVDYERYQGVSLTEAGRRIALEVIRHHRLIETYLSEALGYAWDEVHQEAHRLEHVISEAFEERIDEILGRPSFDPHGHPIPDRDGKLPQREEIPLTDLAVGAPAFISRVQSQDGGFLRYLEQIGFTLHREVEVTERSASLQQITVRIMAEQDTHSLDPSVTDRIFVSFSLP
jgi:DtxR family Mn-dependent transcriptional regulator